MRSLRALPLTLVLLPACNSTVDAPRQEVVHAEQFETRQELAFDFAPYVDPRPAPSPEPVRLERVTTAVPWPRGLAWVDGELVVLARGRHRRAGGVDPSIADHAGALFSVDADVSDPVVPGEDASEAVKANGRVLAAAQGPPFHLYDAASGPPAEDRLMDRPYCTLKYDPLSQNFFICGYSGVDLPEAKFRKNATDSIHRYDRRSGRWYQVEMHDAAVVPAVELGYTVPNQYYPHHDPAQNPPPHGWVNGADGAEVAGEFLYVVAKDNHMLVQYDLGGIRRDPDAPAPASRPVLGSRVTLRLGGEEREVPLYGHSALAAHEGYLYVGFRTSSVVVRFPLDARGDLVHPAVGELIAVFDPYRPGEKSANLIDIAFDRAGELYVSCASAGAIWRVGRPDPDRVFNGLLGGDPATENAPYVRMGELTGKPKARTGNILFDDRDRLYVCSGNYDSGTNIAGVIYRAVPAGG